MPPVEAELAFKLSFVVIFVTVATLGTRAARLSASRHGTAVNQLSHEAKGLLWVRGALGLVFYATLIAWMFMPARLRWSYATIPTSVRIAALGVALPVILFLASAYRALGANYRGGVGLHEDHQLVMAGPYARVRHPIYVAFVLLMAVVLLLSSNWLLGGSGLLLVMSIPAVRVPTEERELAERFGPEWDAYRERTAAFVPRWSGLAGLRQE